MILNGFEIGAPVASGEAVNLKICANILEGIGFGAETWVFCELTQIKWYQTANIFVPAAPRYRGIDTARGCLRGPSLNAAFRRGRFSNDFLETGFCSTSPVEWEF